MIKKYRKKPVTIEAIQFEDNADCILAIHEFVGQETTRVNYEDKDNPYIKIETLEGTMKALLKTCELGCKVPLNQRLIHIIFAARRTLKL